MSSLSDRFTFDNFTMRSVEDRDVDVLVHIINEAYSYQDSAKGEPRTNPTHLRRKIGETDFYAVLHEAAVIGCVYLETKKPMLHFGLLTLAPSCRGIGLAQAIMAAIEKHGKDEGFSYLVLDYMSLAPWLKKYYESYGFIETGHVNRWGKIDLVEMKMCL